MTRPAEEQPVSTASQEGVSSGTAADRAQRLRRIRFTSQVGEASDGQPPEDAAQPKPQTPPVADEQQPASANLPDDGRPPDSPTAVAETSRAPARAPAGVNQELWSPIVAAMEGLEHDEQVFGLISRAAAAVERSSRRQSRLEAQLAELVQVLESAAHFAEL